MNNSFTKHYSSRRGFALTAWNRLLYLLGLFRVYQDIDWNLVDRLVFICKGNICRSAYAEAVAQTLDIESLSAGLDTVTGAPANERSIYAAEKQGINLKRHRTTPVSSVEIKKGDLFIAMEPLQLSQVQSVFGDKYQYTLLGLWSTPVKPYIHDPYGASSIYFDQCFQYIDSSVREIAHLKRSREKYG